MSANPFDFRSENHCPECGATVVGGQAGCQSLFEEIGFRATQHPAIAAVHWLAVDAYCMQHVERYCVSAKSYAAHLTGLCCGVEHGGDRQIYAAIQRWLNGKVALDKPSVLSQRGVMTIVDVVADQDVDKVRTRVKEWADCVWDAYVTQHETARNWLKAALDGQRKHK
jgi:hypothetical protein